MKGIRSPLATGGTVGAVRYVTNAGSAHHRLMAAAVNTIKNIIFGRTSVYFGGVLGPLGMNRRDGSRITRVIEATTMKMKSITAFMKYVRNVVAKASPANKMLVRSFLLTALKKRNNARGENATPVTFG